MDMERTLDVINEGSKSAFARKHAVMSYQEYLGLLAQRPYTLTRNAPQYVRDMMEHYGSYEVSGLGGNVRRWRLFDNPDGRGGARVYGQEEVQERLYEVLSEFVHRGKADRCVLLHGPNGSAKSSLVEALMLGLESYSRTDAGPLFRFSWIFCEQQERTSLGFQQDANVEELDSYAHVDERLISQRIPCEMKDPPFYLLPKRRRRELADQALAEVDDAERERFQWTEFLEYGDLSPKNKTIYESLLKVYQGDWRKVIRHIRVERFYVSHRYRTGAVTIEPQGTIDAGARMLGHGAMSGLPPVLGHETLTEAHGDLVDANAGIVEYSDFLKRSMEANKYLLTTAERGFVNLPSLTISLNLVLMGSTNEKYLVSFKRDPSFTSFKGRFELIRVPYLRVYKKEAQIYQRHLEKVCTRHHIAPHTATVAALWAVLTRLRRPDPNRYDGPLARVVKRITPLQKARLYDRGELPSGLNEEEQKLLRAHIADLAAEWDGREEEFENYADAAYEGRRGASAREMMALLTEMVVECEHASVTPVDVFEVLPKLIADPSLYSFLRIEPDQGYHDYEGFIPQVRKEYIRHLASEIQKASDLVEETEYRRLFEDYILHVKAYGTKEKVENPQTGKAEDPDEGLMTEVEKHLGIKEDNQAFRGNLITKIAAFRLSNPEAPLVFDDLFRDHFEALERSFFRERQERILVMVTDALQVHAGGGGELVPDRLAAAKNLEQRLISDFSYCTSSVARVLGFFHRHHEDLEW